jgi:Astacin (Peptidase family M12A)
MTFAFRPLAAGICFFLFAFSQILSSDTPPGAGPEPASKYRWPAGVIPYVIDYDIPHQERLMGAIQQWTDLTPIRLVRRTNEPDYVRFVREDNDGLCFSSIGMMGGEQKIRVDDRCETGTLVHEIGHTVGLWHEQSRSDRDRFVRVLYQNISRASVRDFDRHINEERDFSPYDFASIMHYGEFADSEERRGPSIETIPRGIPIGQRDTLSLGDIDAVCHMYGFQPKYVTINTHASGLKILVDGVTVVAPQRFDWKPGSRHTLGIPPDQLAGGMRYEFGRWTDDGKADHTITVSPEVTIYTANFIPAGKAEVANGRIGHNDGKRGKKSNQSNRTRPGSVDPGRAVGADGQNHRTGSLQSGHPSTEAH